jgi:WhiB family redox-sensing transcriptional regulator
MMETIPCAAREGDLWFSQLPSAVELAKQLCRSCPLARPCLESALARHEPWGVWGGELLERGVVVPRKRPMGRPRKDEVARRRTEALRVA